MSLHRHGGPYEHGGHEHWPAGLCLRADGTGHTYAWLTECEICGKQFRWAGVLRNAEKRCHQDRKKTLQ
jgi:hypothetical protein